MRPFRFVPGWSKHAEGSCLVECGDTRVLCTASVDATLPAWLRNSGSGWVTAEYGMLPRATGNRNQREGARLRPDGRTIEIQRLIGRSLRGAVDLRMLGERSIVVDCDVIQADGGTRCASICGAWVALRQAIDRLRAGGEINGQPMRSNVAAISVGVVGRQELLDLAYEEDARASLDMNVVMTEGGRLIEVQAGGEGQTFTRAELGRLLELAKIGIDQIVPLQNEALKAAAPRE
jgi:ribonuclease PH